MFYTKRDLVKMGERASFDLFSNETPLVDSVIKVASEKDLNQEQIKRVCHAANTKTMIQIYKSASDNTKEFDVVDPACVLKVVGGVEKTASIEIIDDDYSVPMDKHMHKLASKSLPKKRTKLMVSEELSAMKKTASTRRLQAMEAKSIVKHSLYKHAGALADLADTIIDAKEDGISTDAMLQAALRTGDDPNIVKKAFEQALELVRKKKPGFLSRMWSGFTGLFKRASDGSLEVDSDLISKKLKEMNGNLPVEVLNKNHPLNIALEEVFATRDELKTMDAGTRTVEQSAQVAADRVNELRTELKGCKND